MQLLTAIRPLGVDLFCFGKKFLVFNLVSRNLKVKYHRSIIGIFWTLLSPLANTAIFYFVFKVVMNVQIPHYLAFIVSGILPWSFFSQTMIEGMESIVGSMGLVSKVPIPVQVFPFVGALTNLVTLSLALPILIGTAYLSGVNLGFSLILIPVYFLMLFFLAFGFSLSLAVLFVLFRDLRHLMGIVMQIWFYGTPIIFQESMIPQKYQWVIYFNPLSFIFIDLHSILARGEWPVAQHFLVAGLWTTAALCLSTIILKYFGNNLVEQL